MGSRTRRLAVPVVVGLAVLGGASPAFADGGLSVTPAVLEHRAQLGGVGSYTLNNTTRETLRVTVTVRPWRQQLNGTVIADPRANLTRYVRATTRTFTLAAGAKRAGVVPDGAARAPAARSTPASRRSASRPAPRAARGSSRSTGSSPRCG